MWPVGEFPAVARLWAPRKPTWQAATLREANTKRNRLHRGTNSTIHFTFGRTYFDVFEPGLQSDNSGSATFWLAKRQISLPQFTSFSHKDQELVELSRMCGGQTQFQQDPRLSITLNARHSPLWGGPYPRNIKTVPLIFACFASRSK